MKTVVLGTGSWGTALAQVLADNGNPVTLWGINEFEVNDINENHRNSHFFESEINPALNATLDLSCVKDADLLLLAVPSIAYEEVVTKVVKILDHPVIFINVSKGFHPTTHELLSTYLKNTVDPKYLRSVVSLIGPSHAEEVVIRQLTLLNAVSDHEEDAKLVQSMFSNGYFRVYTNTDVVGAEIGVAIKNIMALASGILEGIGQGDNAKAALITRGLAEMTRYGIACGGRMETFLGLDGVGDLIVTCMSRHSRNFMAGYQIGQDGGAERFMKENKKTVEGIFACRIIYDEAKKKGISMPITDEMYAVLYENKSPVDALNDLMNRDLKAE